MLSLLEEGKKEALELLDKNFGSDSKLKNELLNIDETPSKGDIPFIIRFYKEENSDLNSIKQYFKKYYTFKKRNIPVKSPSNFKDFISWTEHLDNVEALRAMKNSTNQNVEISSEDDQNKIAEDSDLVIYKGDSQQRCIKYGQGYSFCISRPYGGNMYDSYRLSNESSFYFIFFKKTPKKDPKHIMVLDKTKDGWKWTFGNNNTQDTTWEDVINKFPVLEKYESLFINNPLTDFEKEKIQFLKDFKENQSLKKFKNAHKEFQIIVLKSGITLTDKIYYYLEENNLWELINEYVSVGPNLTPLQAESIERKGGSILNHYLKNRELSIPQLELQVFYDRYQFNKLDRHVPYIKEKIGKANERARKYIKDESQTTSPFIYFKDETFLLELPDNLPETVGEMTIMNCGLFSLKNCPKIVEGTFICHNNTNLTSLKGAPSNVGGDFIYTCSKLTSLEGAPRIVGRDFDCSFNNLTSLEGIPEKIGGNFDCRKNFLTSLKGAPERVGGSFMCDDNYLTSLKGAPRSIGGSFYCVYNSLTSLEGIPEKIGENINISNNPKNFTAEEIRQAMEESRKKNELKSESFKFFYYNYIG